MNRGCKSGSFSKLLFYSKKLIVFGHPICSGRGAGFNLACIGTHGQICNGRILCLAGTMRDDDAVVRFFSHLNDFEGFGQRPDLVELYEDGISKASCFPVEAPEGTEALPP